MMLARPYLALFAGLLAAWVSSACGGARLEAVHSSVQKPSNVAFYVAVEDGGEPVTGLTERNFQVEEDGTVLEVSETRLTLLDRDPVAIHHTLVLVDLSGSFDEKGRDLTSRGVRHLVEKLRPTQGITVLGFDGSQRLHPLGEFPRSKQASKPELSSISRFRSSDESRNLNGAVIEGLRQLDARLMRHAKPVRVGALVVFTQGDDLAARVSEDDLRKALDETPHRIYAIGIEGRDARQLDPIGRHGVQRSQDAFSVPIAFQELSSKLKKEWSKFYLVQYCSPARGGIRRVRLAVDYENAEGKSAKGSVDREFDAAGFRGGCDPKARPRFTTALSRPGEIEAERRDKAAAKKSGKSGSQAGSEGGAPSSPAEETIVAPPPSGDYAD